MVLLAILAAATACRKEEGIERAEYSPENTLMEQPKFTTSNVNLEGETILGRKLQNPYTVDVMRKAATEILKKGFRLLDPAKIEASHYYFKFMPADSVQFQLLDNERNLTLYPYPLDYEIIRGGNEYRDPAQDKGDYAWQYASVRVSQRFDQRITHQKLAELYIPEEDPLFSKGQNEEYLDALLDEAYKLTKNYQDTLKIEMGKVQKKSYHPGGKIQIFDTRLNQLIGLEGVDMRARRWFTTRHARTDFWGNYRMAGTFKRPCNYSLWFSQSDFTVKKHLIALTAWINGPKINEDWDYDILNGHDRFLGHIFRAALRYHYGFIDGLKRPIRPISRTKYIGVDGTTRSEGFNYIVLPIIRIGRFKENNELESDEVYSTTCHETAHTSHALIMKTSINMLQVTHQIIESWAVGVEWWLTKLEYKNVRGIGNYGDWSYATWTNFPNYKGYQLWTPSSDGNKYTSLFINLIDFYNDKQMSLSPETPDDEVSGYTFSNIERNMLNDCYGKSSLAVQLKSHKPIGLTDAAIDKLLSYY